MAQTLLHRSPRGVGRAGSSGSSPDFFPQSSSSKLKPWPVNCQPSTVARSPAGAPPTGYNKSNRAVGWPPAVAVLCGAGYTKTPFGPGISAAGSFHGIRSLPPRRVACSTYTPASGKAVLSTKMSLSSLPTKRPAFRPAVGSTAPRTVGRILPCVSSTSTFVVAPGPISLHWTCTTPESSAAVKPRTALHPSIDWSIKS